jgi:sulfate adenylyltransferase
MRTLSEGHVCDLELLLNGGFAPLTGFMTEEDYDACLQSCRLKDGTVWPMPITLSFCENQLPDVGDVVPLEDFDHRILAHLHVESVWSTSVRDECLAVAGTDDTNHPYVAEKMVEADDDGMLHYAGGKVVQYKDGVTRNDFLALRKSPSEVKTMIANLGWKTVLGFQTRNPMHRCHIELALQAAKSAGVDGILLNPAVGPTQPGDIDYRVRVRCYEHAVKRMSETLATELALLPLRMRMCGPREALWHALIRKNFGCTHFAVGRDHAGPSMRRSDTGEPFYGAYDAHKLVTRFKGEIGIEVVLSPELVFVEQTQRYERGSDVTPGHTTTSLSGTELRRRLANNEDIPEWFSYPEIVAELRRASANVQKKGLVLYFVGLSGSGKTTLAQRVIGILGEMDPCLNITSLDADVVRKHLSKGLGFSKEDRSTNVQRIGFVASVVAKHKGICVVANIAPFEADRQANRRVVEEAGGNYVEIFVDTPFDVCAQRDVCGLYAKLGDKMTGAVEGSWERPSQSDLVVNTCEESVEAASKRIVAWLQSKRHL